MQPCFPYRSVFIKPFFISAARHIFTKLLAVSEISVKVKVRLRGALFVTLLTSAVICKQRFLHGNEIVQYFQKCKCYKVSQNHFRKARKLSLNMEL